MACRTPLAAQSRTQRGETALAEAPAPQTDAAPEQTAPAAVPNPQTAAGHGARMGGTVTDENGDLIPGATVTLEDGTTAEQRRVIAGDNAEFEFTNLKPGVAYRLTVHISGFKDWSSPAITLDPDQYLFVKDIHLRAVAEATTVTVSGSPVEIATEQVHLEEQQRVMGFIPNFYVVYDSANAAPMTTKLKFHMAFRVLMDPIDFAGAAFLAGVNQAADTPDYVQGAKGYGQRFGAVYADGFTDLIFGGAILPALLHQDPRYYYKGTGTTKSRLMYALAGPFVCKGDNGKWQPNYSSMGGDLISGAISNLYYPQSNRGASLVFGGFLINTAEREVSTTVQEFVLRRLTRHARKPPQ
ncbi:MAG: carboxypeptidase-like regulatory domain-containing protein [Terracidiphilus sp.]